MRAPGPKKTSGIFYALFLGDSIMDGVGEDPTEVDDGADDLHYGDAPIPAGVTLYHDGVLKTGTYWNTNPSPRPSVIPWVVNAALAAGFDQVVVVRYSSSGSTTNTVDTVEFTAAIDFARRNGVTRFDLVAVAAGSNDSGALQSAAFVGAGGSGRRLIRHLRESEPDARIAWLKPIVSSATRAEADIVRAEIDTIVSENNGYVYAIEGAGLAAVDGVHPTLLTTRTQATAIFPGWLAAP